MLSNIIDIFYSKAIIIPGLLIAITLHELAHGYVAYMLGDPTAKNNGRLTLNPIKHIDVMGFLLLFLVGFGWAKPVPINPKYFKKRKRGTFIVSIAGPIMNFILAFIFSIIYMSGIVNGTVLTIIFKTTIFYNIVLGIFNLLPFPPLDGSKIMASLLPVKYEFLFYKYENNLRIILIILVLTNTIEKILGPLVNISFNLLANLTSIFII